MSAIQSCCLLLLFVLPLTLQADESQLCHSMEIHTLQDLTQLQKCSIVVGHVEIFNIDFPSDAGTSYSTSVMEITDYLLIHRVHGLKSLQQLLPQLMLIRGAELLLERYAFVVYENRDLEELSLVSLLRIQRGSVRIESNPVLCFVETINWIYLLKNVTQQHFTLKGNKSPNHCPLCMKSNVLEVEPENEYDTRHCWNLQSYQRNIAGRRSNCEVVCDPPFCDRYGHCCSANCISGCMGVGCSLCASLMLKETCLDNCNVPLYQLNKRECVLESVCRRRGLIPHALQCLKSCPDNYQLLNNSIGLTSCIPICSGTFVINTANDLYKLADCTTINGSLIVELTNIKGQIIAEMERTLLGLKEITGYLKVVRSPQLISLNFLQRLDTISGNELIDNKYALYVVDNHHLEQIWAKNQKVAILKGHVYFHLNPRLCHNKIMQLSDSLKSAPKISIQDASPNSNGERVICENMQTINATIEDISATEVRTKMTPFSSNEISVIIGYTHHYKESPLRNVTMYDGRHGCGHDRWLMDISLSKNIRYVIRNLKPNTQYAYFIKTISYTDYHSRLDAYSDIIYFTTSSSKPDPVAKIYTNSLSSTEMIVHWWPPRISKGPIIKYLLTYEAVESPNVTSTENYIYSSESNTIEESCQCDLRDPDYSGSLPEDENYYNKEQLTYDEAINDCLIKPNNQPRDKGDLKDKEEAYHKYTEQMEKDAHDLQDTGIGDFLIKKPLPICIDPKPSKEIQKNNNCTMQERYNGTVIPGHQHSFTLRNLQPKVAYRVSIRACVKGLDNGCGPEKSITAVTVSKGLEDILREFKAFQEAEIKN